MRNYAERFTLTLGIIWHKIVSLQACTLECRNLWVFCPEKQGIAQCRFLYFLSCVLSHELSFVYWPPLRQSHHKQTCLLKIQLSR